MTRVKWDQVGQRQYETGTDRGVLYIPTNGVYNQGFPWNGLTAVTESPSGAEATPLYADNIQYLNLLSVEKFAGTIEAYTYPDEFGQCDGTAQPAVGVYVGQQPRKTFGLSYRTIVGNDTELNEHGYKLHLVWGCLASPSEKAYATVNDSPEPITFSWDFSTTPVDVTGLKPAASITIDSTKVDPSDLAELEDMLYGTVGQDPMLPSPDAVIAIFNAALTSVTPTEPAYNSTTDEVTIPAVTGVVYYINGEVVTGTVVITGDTFIQAMPAPGYKFPAIADSDWTITFA